MYQIWVAEPDLTSMYSLFSSTHAYQYVQILCSMILTLDQIKTRPPVTTFVLQIHSTHSVLTQIPMNTMLWKAAAYTNTHENTDKNRDSHSYEHYTMEASCWYKYTWKYGYKYRFTNTQHTVCWLSFLSTLCYVASSGHSSSVTMHIILDFEFF